MNPQEFWPSDHKTPSWLPNWKYEDEYPNSKNATKHDFAWEFLRRNFTYQLDYKRISALCVAEAVQDTYQNALGINIFPKSSQLPKSIKFHAELYRTLAKWGLSYLLLDPAHGISHPETKVYEYYPQEDDDPKVTTRNRYVSLNIKDLSPDHQRRYKLVPEVDTKDDVDLNFMGRIGLFTHAIETVKYDEQDIPIDGGIIPSDKEVSYLFDLALPVKPQMETAEKLLKESQRQLLGKNLESSGTSIKDLTTYLRLLDADAHRTSNSEIRATLFSGKRSTALDDARKGAYPLLEGNYKLLF